MLPGKKYTPEEIIKLLLAHKWLIVLPFFLGLSAAIVVASKIPGRYRSETLIMVVPQRVSEALVKPTVNNDKIEERLLSISDQIQSRSRLEHIITDFNLYSDKRRRGMIMEDVVGLMRTDILVNIDLRGKDSFRLSYENQDAQVAHKVTERLASLYIEENLRDKEHLAESTDQFLESQLEDAKHRLIEQEKKLETYRRTYAGQLPTEVETNQQAIQNAQLQLQAVSDSINRARERRLLVERQKVDAETMPLPVAPMDTSAASPDAVVTLTTAQQLDAAQAKLAAFRLRYKPEHPDIRALERTVRELQAKLDKEAANPQPVTKPVSAAEVARQKRIRDLQADLDVIDRQITTAEAEQDRLKGVINNLQSRLAAVPTRESELVELTRDYNTLQATYQGLLAKREDSKLAANLERRQIGETFKVIDPPSMPQRPINQKVRMGVVGAGAVGGLMLGLALIGLIEYRDSSFKKEEDAARLLALPVLAVVPLMASELERVRQRRRRVFASVMTVVVLVVGSAALVFWKLFS